MGKDQSVVALQGRGEGGRGRGALVDESEAGSERQLRTQSSFIWPTTDPLRKRYVFMYLWMVWVGLMGENVAAVPVRSVLISNSKKKNQKNGLKRYWC